MEALRIQVMVSNGGKTLENFPDKGKKELVLRTAYMGGRGQTNGFGSRKVQTTPAGREIALLTINYTRGIAKSFNRLWLVSIR